MPSPSEVSNFQDLIASLAAVAVTRTTELVSATQDPATLSDVYPATLDPFIAASGQLTAEWYHSLAPDAAFAVEPAPAPPRQALSVNVRWALTQPNIVEAVTGAAERQVFTMSRDTVLVNAEREGVRYARYASANACAWCRVLATREAVYHSAETAVKGHDNCHCIAVPERGGNTYTPPDYVKGWLDDYNAARGEVGGNLNDIVNHMRRTA